VKIEVIFMTKKQLKTTWSHNPEYGEVLGRILTKPEILISDDKTGLFVAHAMLMDHSKKKWRIRVIGVFAEQLLSLSVNDKVVLIGFKGDLCPGAYFNAKRQIIPDEIIFND
jgi:hypothetical protein